MAASITEDPAGPSGGNARHIRAETAEFVLPRIASKVVEADVIVVTVAVRMSSVVFAEISTVVCAVIGVDRGTSAKRTAMNANAASIGNRNC
jgi:hypothetical protein